MVDGLSCIMADKHIFEILGGTDGRAELEGCRVESPVVVSLRDYIPASLQSLFTLMY